MFGIGKRVLVAGAQVRKMAGQGSFDTSGIEETRFVEEACNFLQIRGTFRYSIAKHPLQCVGLSWS